MGVGLALVLAMAGAAAGALSHAPNFTDDDGGLAKDISTCMQI
jgi:hypothetical protein